MRLAPLFVSLHSAISRGVAHALEPNMADSDGKPAIAAALNSSADAVRDRFRCAITDPLVPRYVINTPIIDSSDHVTAVALDLMSAGLYRPPARECLMQIQAQAVPVVLHALEVEEQTTEVSMAFRNGAEWKIAAVPLVNAVRSVRYGFLSYDEAEPEILVDVLDWLHALPEKCSIVTMGMNLVSFMQSLVVLASTGTDRIRHDGASHRTNTKRVSEGKAPILGYVEILATATRGEGSLSHGVRSTPRVHIRRGHVRTLADGTQTWVRPCIVAATAKHKQAFKRRQLEAGGYR